MAAPQPQPPAHDQPPHAPLPACGSQPGEGATSASGSTAVCLVDLRPLQRRLPSLPPAELQALLEAAPESLQGVGWLPLLAAGGSWADSEAGAGLLRWLAGRPAILIPAPWLEASAVELVALWHGLTRLCTPSFDPPQWQWRDLPSPPLASEGPERLAYFSPLPPARSGLSDYSLALLPALAAHFSIAVVSADPPPQPLPPGVSAWITPADFARGSAADGHCLFHLGNATVHLPNLQLLARFGGAVVLHDFYLSHALCAPQADGWLATHSLERMYRSHGYRAALAWQWCQRQHSDGAIWAFPCNLAPLQWAAGVIVHSQEACRLADHHFGSGTSADWQVIPHLKAPQSLPERGPMRQNLAVGPEAFVVASFGFMGPAKCSALLLEAFLASGLAADPACLLVFAGSFGGNRSLQQAMEAMLARARRAGRLRAQVRFTGWTDPATYRAWLAATDLAVQLRSRSRGESSGTVLDCLAAGIPLIFNAHGSLRELDPDCGLRLEDGCGVAEVRAALERLHADPAERAALGQRGRATVEQGHRPQHCAALYAQAIHRAGAVQARRRAAQTLARRALAAAQPSVEVHEAANALVRLLPPHPVQRQLLLDVSALAEEDLGSGVQRVVRRIGEELLACPPRGFRVEPVRACRDGAGFLYARRFTSRWLGLASPPLPDTPVLPGAGDVFLGIDLHHDGILRQRAALQDLRVQGVSVHFVVHDLLPCLLPDCFPPGADQLHGAWLQVVTACDGAVCVSRSVADDLAAWLVEHPPAGGASFPIGWFHHGCDFVPAQPADSQAVAVELSLGARRFGPGPVLLMVGTIEPRKGYLDVIEAASLLWQRGLHFNLVLVGREGWRGLPERDRRTIPRTVAAIRRHPLLNQRLFWFAAVDDDQLQALYRRSDALIAASYGEGFGIPLIEAASRGLPLLVRDLPVFREVAGEATLTFPRSADASRIAAAIEDLLARLQDGAGTGAPPLALEPQTWRQSAAQLLHALGLEPGLPLEGLGPLPALPERSDRPPLSRHRRFLRRLKQLLRRLKRLLARWRAMRFAGLPAPAGSGGPPLIPGAEAWLQVLREPADNQEARVR